MSYVSPQAVVECMLASGVAKAKAAPLPTLVRSTLSGALLGFATALAITATLQTGVPLVGALVFPVGLVMIVLLGLDLLTGSFALLPIAVIDGRVGQGRMWNHFGLVLLGNLAGALLYAALMAATLQGPAGAALADKIVAITQAKTTGYMALGALGMASVFIKAILCNWMVCLGVVLAMTSTSTAGKILATWLAIFTFFALGYEHAIVNIFLIPAGMLLGAKITIAQWLAWNAIPVTLGNFVGGFLCTGLALYLSWRPARAVAPAAAAVASADPAPAPPPAATRPVRDAIAELTA
jgi:formate/nitrite transporter